MELLICFRSSVRDLNFSVQISVDAPVVTQSFQRLEKDERIETEIFHVGKVAAGFKEYHKEGYIYIPADDFEYFRKREQELVEEEEGNYKGYKMQRKQKKVLLQRNIKKFVILFSRNWKGKQNLSMYIQPLK